MECHHCRRELSEKDFGSGRALTLLGIPYCDECLDHAVREGRRKATVPSEQAAAPCPPEGPSPSSPEEKKQESWTQRRLHVRFAPPLDCTLRVSADPDPGPGDTVLRTWVDVSEGGFRAVVQGEFRTGDRFQGELCHLPSGVRYSFKAEACHVKPSVRYEQGLLVGFKFLSPDPALQAFIREMLDLPRAQDPGGTKAGAPESGLRESA